MRATAVLSVLALVLASPLAGQRIRTVEVANSRYFISNESPYSPQLNWFLAYEYCRTIGMELLSFEKVDEANEVYEFLKSNSFINSNYWTSGNQLGSEMWIWMSTGQPLNNTFNFWEAGGPPLTKSQQSCLSTERETWIPQNCMDQKHFICEQTRCFYFNYVTTNRGASQGNTTIMPGVTRIPDRPFHRPIRPVVRTVTQPSTVNSRQEQQQQHQAQLQIRQEQGKTNPITVSRSTFNQSVTTQSSKIKVMSDRSSTLDDETSATPTPLKVMTTPQHITKVMVTPAPEQDIKTMPLALQTESTQQMPLKHVSPDNPIATHNNEIIPTGPVSLLQLLHPPTQEFIPGESETEKPKDTRITGPLSRKETFSWALEDYNSQ